MIIKEKELNQSNNDMYVMEVVSDRIIVNNNYKGVLILDNNLNLIKKINLFKDIIVYKSYINRASMEMLLFCEENQCMVYINLINYNHKIISLKNELEDIMFSNIYQWNSSGVVLSTYDNEFYEICIHNREVKKLNHSQVKENYSELHRFYKTIVNGETMFGDVVGEFKDGYIVREEDEKVYINTQNKDEYVFEKNISNTFDIQFIEGVAAIVSEDFIEIVKGNYKERISINKDNMFLRVRFLKKLNETYIISLSSNKSNIRKSKIEMYKLNLTNNLS